MPKKLLIVRHAKSDWGIPEVTDFNRPLNQRGNSNAKLMGEWLLKKSVFPQLMVSSPALRAINTAKLVATEVGYDLVKIEENKIVYNANCNALLNVINGFENQYDFIAIFGHNYGITDLVIYLTDAEIFNIPTCGMVMIDFPFDDWKMISEHTGEINFYEYPKNIIEFS